jgi:hypothetical protein
LAFEVVIAVADGDGLEFGEGLLLVTVVVTIGLLVMVVPVVAVNRGL